MRLASVIATTEHHHKDGSSKVRSHPTFYVDLDLWGTRAKDEGTKRQLARVLNPGPRDTVRVSIHELETSGSEGYATHELTQVSTYK